MNGSFRLAANSSGTFPTVMTAWIFHTPATGPGSRSQLPAIAILAATIALGSMDEHGGT